VAAELFVEIVAALSLFDFDRTAEGLAVCGPVIYLPSLYILIELFLYLADLFLLVVNNALQFSVLEVVAVEHHPQLVDLVETHQIHAS
jgi:hypothetical protein